MTNTFGQESHPPELKVIKLLPKGKSLLLFGKPFHPKITERGVQKGEENLEQPIGNDQAEDKCDGEFRSCLIKCNKHKYHGVNELARYGTQVVSQPEPLSLAQFLEQQKNIDIDCLTDGKADQGSKAHAHAHAEYLTVFVLQLPTGVRLNLHKQCRRGKKNHKHDDRVSDEQGGMIVAFHFSDDIGDQKEDRHEKNSHRDSHPEQAYDFTSNSVDQYHARYVKSEE
ncbi:hypothetical protein SDC9_47467 [bioreactor metagenome]|uniref:Uncharacterized protein n=1 Tax=bioreactor metagenome TaxID=1076179 RepID=A0A644WCC0_9ZZZZ